jgi:hypothetical protein
MAMRAEIFAVRSWANDLLIRLFCGFLQRHLKNLLAQRWKR